MVSTIYDLPFDVLFLLKKYLDFKSLLHLRKTCTHFWEWGQLNDSKVAPSYLEILSRVLYPDKQKNSFWYETKSLNHCDWKSILSIFPFSLNFCKCSIRINFVNVFEIEKSQWTSITFCDKHHNFISTHKLEPPIFVHIFQSIDELLLFIQLNDKKIELPFREFRYYGWDDYTFVKSSDNDFTIDFCRYRSFPTPSRNCDMGWMDEIIIKNSFL
jgi:hypothetical protein